MPIVFIDIFQDTLLPTSLYILTINLVVFQFLPGFGAWIDQDDRLRVQQISLVMENVCVVAAAVIICGVTAASSEAHSSLSDWQTVLWFIGLLVLGSVGELFNSTTVISIDKDWVVAIAKESGAPLQEMNTRIRRIDLVCKAASPAVFAVLYQAYGSSSQIRVFYGTGMVGLWNLLSFPIEFALVRTIYREFTSLAEKVHVHSNSREHSHKLGHKEHFHVVQTGLLQDADSMLSKLIIPKAAVQESNPALLDPNKFIGGSGVQVATLLNKADGREDAKVDASTPLDDLAIENAPTAEDPTAVFRSSGGYVLLEDGYELVGRPPKESQCCRVFCKFASGMKTYTAQDIFLPSVSFAMIFMTVLDNGGLVTSYLEWSGVGTTWIGIGRGAGAVIGLIGTFLYPCLTRRLSNSVPASGLFSLWAFWINLLPIAIVLLLGEAFWNTVPYTLLICVSSSRAFLWMFDLSNVELIQTRVSDSERGTVSSMQTAMSQFFLILVNLAGVISPDPRNFHWLVVMSLVVVLSAAMLYTFWFTRSSCANRTQEQ